MLLHNYEYSHMHEHMRIHRHTHSYCLLLMLFDGPQSSSQDSGPGEIMQTIDTIQREADCSRPGSRPRSQEAATLE